MSKESINLLKIQLYLEYYKKDITDRYIRCIDKIVLDNDVLNNLDERMYITTLDVYNELKLVKEENFKLQARSDRYKNIIDKLEKWLEEEIKHYKEHFEFVCKSHSPVPIDDTKIILEKDDLIIQKLEKVLDKIQELKGSDEE